MDLAAFRTVSADSMRGERCSRRAGRIAFAAHMDREGSEMTRQKVITILGVVLAFACVAKAGFAQTQATTSNGTQTSGDQDQSAAAMAQEAANPFSSRWLLQIQQNNNWMDMPLESGDRMQSNLLFQPLMSVALSREVGALHASSPHRRQFLAPPRSERPQ